MGYMALRKKKKREDFIFSIFLIIIIIASFLPFIRQTNELSFLTDEFRLQYFLISGLIFLLTFYKKRFKTSLIAFFLAILNLAVIASHINFFEKPNLKNWNFNFAFYRFADFQGENHNRIIDDLNQKDQDLVIILDLAPDLTQNILKDLEPSWSIKHANCYQGRDCLILSRFEVKDYGKISFLESYNDYALWVSYLNQDHLFTVVVFNEGEFNFDYINKNYKIHKLSSFIKSRDEPVILMGGFSSVPWSQRYSSFETEASLFTKGGLKPNWPSPLFWPLRLPMDHIYAHAGIDVLISELKKFKEINYRVLKGKIFISK